MKFSKLILKNILRNSDAHYLQVRVLCIAVLVITLATILTESTRAAPKLPTAPVDPHSFPDLRSAPAHPTTNDHRPRREERHAV